MLLLYMEIHKREKGEGKIKGIYLSYGGGQPKSTVFFGKSVTLTVTPTNHQPPTPDNINLITLNDRESSI